MGTGCVTCVSLYRRHANAFTRWTCTQRLAHPTWRGVISESCGRFFWDAESRNTMRCNLVRLARLVYRFEEMDKMASRPQAELSLSC